MMPISCGLEPKEDLASKILVVKNEIVTKETKNCKPRLGKKEL
jgi:hypothetical protein